MLKEYALAYPQGGRPPKHGKEFRFAKPETWGELDAATVQVTDRYGTARAMAWDRIHPRLTTRSAWIDHTSELPVIEGTLIRLQVDRLPGGGDPLPLWLWASATDLNSEDVDVRWQAFLRRFDLERCFNRLKQWRGIATRYDNVRGDRVDTGTGIALQGPYGRTPALSATSAALAPHRDVWAVHDFHSLSA